MEQTRLLYSNTICCMNYWKEGYNNSLEDFWFTCSNCEQVIYRIDSLSHTITEAQRFERAFVSLETSYLAESRLNPSNPSLLLSLTLALELQKTLSSFKTKVDIFWVFSIFTVRPCRYLVADSINNAFKRKQEASEFHVSSNFPNSWKKIIENTYIWSFWRMSLQCVCFWVWSLPETSCWHRHRHAYFVALHVASIASVRLLMEDLVLPT